MNLYNIGNECVLLKNDVQEGLSSGLDWACVQEDICSPFLPLAQFLPFTAS